MRAMKTDPTSIVEHVCMCAGVWCVYVCVFACVGGGVVSF